MKHTEEAKAKMRTYTKTESHKNNLAKALSGNKNHAGKPHDADTKRRISEKLRGRTLSAATRAKMSASWYPRGNALPRTLKP